MEFNSKRLENKIKTLVGRFSEFVDKINLEVLEKNAFRKSYYLGEILKIEEQKEKEFLNNVVLHFDLMVSYKGFYQDNEERSEKDREQILTFQGKPVELNFPQSDKFFRDGFESLMYEVKCLSRLEAKEEAEKAFKGYKLAYEFWAKELAIGA